MSFQDAFRQNLKYISQTEIDHDIIERQFVKTNDRYYLTVGAVNLPSGKIRVGDPLAYMCKGEFSPELTRTVEPGTYPVEVALSRTRVAGLRICTARIKFNETKAVSYELAKSTDYTAAMHLADGPSSGFPVDAGMLAFVSSEGVDDYIKFIAKWHQENPNGNHYDDYFAAILAESAKQLPQFQREGGDFAEWTIPETDHKIVMIASGFGDGYYQIFWGIDELGEICELIVPLINADIIDKENEEFLKIWDGPEYCVVTKHVAEGGEIRYMSREEAADRFPDNGWRFYGKDEDEDYWNDANNFTIMGIHGLTERFPNIIPLLKSPVGTAYFGTDSGEFILDDFEK